VLALAPKPDRLIRESRPKRGGRAERQADDFLLRLQHPRDHTAIAALAEAPTAARQRLSQVAVPWSTQEISTLLEMIRCQDSGR